MGTVGALVAAFHIAKTGVLINNAVAFPTLHRGVPPPGRPRSAILIPARDESARLPDSLSGFLAQHVDEIIVYDDESTDGTATIVAEIDDPRVRLLTGRPRPAGWTGKNWACHQLAAATTADLLIFCDADVTLAPGALDAVWTQIRSQDADVFSVFGRQHTTTIGERLLVPLIDDVLLAYLPHQLLDQPISAAATATGGLLAFTRAAYEAVGGHEAVADRIVEDVALARRSRRIGLKLGLALGGDLVGIRMYDGYAATVAGFGKSTRAAHGGSDAALVVSAALHLLAYTVPWVCLRRGVGWRIAAALAITERIIVNAKTGRRAYAEAVLVPITAPAALPVYAIALRRTVRWKGRIYR